MKYSVLVGVALIVILGVGAMYGSGVLQPLFLVTDHFSAGSWMTVEYEPKVPAVNSASCRSTQTYTDDYLSYTDGPCGAYTPGQQVTVKGFLYEWNFHMIPMNDPSAWEAAATGSSAHGIPHAIIQIIPTSRNLVYSGATTFYTGPSSMTVTTDATGHFQFTLTLPTTPGFYMGWLLKYEGGTGSIFADTPTSQELQAMTPEAQAYALAKHIDGCHRTILEGVRVYGHNDIGALTYELHVSPEKQYYSIGDIVTIEGRFYCKGPCGGRNYATFQPIPFPYYILRDSKYGCGEDYCNPAPHHDPIPGVEVVTEAQRLAGKERLTQAEREKAWIWPLTETSDKWSFQIRLTNNEFGGFKFSNEVWRIGVIFDSVYPMMTANVMFQCSPDDSPFQSLLSLITSKPPPGKCRVIYDPASLSGSGPFLTWNHPQVTYPYSWPEMPKTNHAEIQYETTNKYTHLGWTGYTFPIHAASTTSTTTISTSQSATQVTTVSQIIPQTTTTVSASQTAVWNPLKALWDWLRCLIWHECGG